MRWAARASCVPIADMQWQKVLLAWMAMTGARCTAPVDESSRSLAFLQTRIRARIDQPLLECEVVWIGRCRRSGEECGQVVEREAGTDQQAASPEASGYRRSQTDVLGRIQVLDQGHLNTGDIGFGIHEQQWDEDPMVVPASLIQSRIDAVRHAGVTQGAGKIRRTGGGVGN